MIEDEYNYHKTTEEHFNITNVLLTENYLAYQLHKQNKAKIA